ncbi:acyl carrier protein [Actinomadura atramentaria]|uniref:acyl carrier protein n=1 Tax=Actinomadura atramentaria TaxID=1990 RepID=UPI0012FBD386|nr:acyl carrier protein [Actinomadura atramentaria]
MTEAEVRERVSALVLDAAPVKTPAADGSLDLGGDLGYDSLGREELAALLEDEFAGLRIPDGVFVPRTLGEVEALVLGLLEASA